MTTSTTTTAVVALTTQFSPSSSCLNDYYATTTKIFVTAPIGYAQLGPPANSACQPSGWKSTSQHFSPGVCPSGYEVACSTIVGAETQATCCPISWSCQKSSNWPQYSTDACTVNGSDLPSSTLMFTSVNGTSTTTYKVINTDAGGLNAYGVSIRWKEADFIATPTTSTTSTLSSTHSSSSATSTSPTASTSQTASTSPAAGSSNTSSLSSGAKAGIGIGVAIGVLAILGALFVLFTRYRRRQMNSMKTTVPTPYKDETYGHYAPVHPSSPRYMANPPQVYHEVDGSSANRVEAHGTPRSELS